MVQTRKERAAGIANAAEATPGTANACTTPAPRSATTLTRRTTRGATPAQPRSATAPTPQSDGGAGRPPRPSASKTGVSVSSRAKPANVNSTPNKKATKVTSLSSCAKGKSSSLASSTPNKKAKTNRAFTCGSKRRIFPDMKGCQGIREALLKGRDRWRHYNKDVVIARYSVSRKVWFDLPLDCCLLYDGIPVLPRDHPQHDAIVTGVLKQLLPDSEEFAELCELASLHQLEKKLRQNILDRVSVDPKWVKSFNFGRFIVEARDGAKSKSAPTSGEVSSDLRALAGAVGHLAEQTNQQMTNLAGQTNQQITNLIGAFGTLQQQIGDLGEQTNQQITNLARGVGTVQQQITNLTGSVGDLSSKVGTVVEGQTQLMGGVEDVENEFIKVKKQ